MIKTTCLIPQIESQLPETEKKKKRDLDGGAHKESKATSYEPLLSIESWLFYRGGWLSGIMEYHRPFPKG